MSRIEETLNVELISDIVPAGVTIPVRCKLSNGSLAYVKYLNNTCGTAALVNELIGNTIADKIGVSVPNFGICNMSKDVIDTNNRNEEIGDDNSGLCFFSEQLEHAVPTPIWKLVQNRETEKILLLDHVLNNFDRHPGNMIFDLKTYRIYAIDYSHIFSKNTMRPDYNSEFVINGMNPGKYLYSDILICNKEVYYDQCIHVGYNERLLREEVAGIQDLLPKEYLKSVVESIPAEWIKCIDGDASDTIVEFLNYRVRNLESICEMIIKERRK